MSEIACTNSGVGLRDRGCGGAATILLKMGLTSARPTVLEVCCRSADLTRELGKFEFNASGIDHDRNRHSPKAKVLIMDLSSKTGGGLLRSLDDARVVAVLFGIP